MAPAGWRGWELGRTHVCPDGMGYSVGAYGEVFVVADEGGFAVGCSAIREPTGVVGVGEAGVDADSAKGGSAVGGCCQCLSILDVGRVIASVLVGDS